MYSFSVFFRCPGIWPNFDNLLGDCNYDTFYEDDSFPIVRTLLANCTDGCSDECNDIEEVYEHPCFTRSLLSYTEKGLEQVTDQYYVTTLYNVIGIWVNGSYVISLLHVCDPETDIYRPSNDEDQYKPGKECGLFTSSAKTVHSHIQLIKLAAALLWWIKFMLSVPDHVQFV